MSKQIKNTISPILKHTPYLGSSTNKIIHSTSAPCTEAFKILPDDRWYIGEIPNDGNYTKCHLCYPGQKKAND